LDFRKKGREIERDCFPSLEAQQQQDRQQLLGFPPNPGLPSLSGPAVDPLLERSVAARRIVKCAPGAVAAAFYFLDMRARARARCTGCNSVRSKEGPEVQRHDEKVRTR